MFVKNYGRYGNPWLDGTIVALSGPVSAIIELSDGNRVRRHFEQIRKRYTESAKPKDISDTVVSDELIPMPVVESGTSSQESQIDENGAGGERTLPDPDDFQSADTPPCPEVPSTKR